jgi:sporulation protein YlmC with PRC-barrel domain
MPSRRFAFAALLLALATPALAQVSTSAPSADRNGSAARPEATETMKPGQLRASKLIGKSVWGPDGKDIGDVAELILDKDGRIERVVVSVGGFLGLGDKQVALPLDEVKWGAEERLTLDMTREQLEAYPRFLFREPGAAAGHGSGRLGATGSSRPSSRISGASDQ